MPFARETEVHTILLKLSDGSDASPAPCRFDDVIAGAVGQVMTAVGLGTLSSGAPHPESEDE